MGAVLRAGQRVDAPAAVDPDRHAGPLQAVENFGDVLRAHHGHAAPGAEDRPRSARRLMARSQTLRISALPG